MKQEVPPTVMARLPRYYRYLRELAAGDELRISSKRLGERMGLTPSQIRQDLRWFGEFGQQGYGYSVRGLFTSICSILGLGDEFTAVLVGRGAYAEAIASLPLFTRCGVRLIARFDLDSTGGDSPDAFFAAHPADIAVLAVADGGEELGLSLSRSAASHGCRGIWNLTNAELDASAIAPGVIVRNLSIGDSLMTLCYEMK